MNRDSLIFDNINDSLSLPAHDVTVLEKLILVTFILFIVTVLILAGWSAVLVLTGGSGGGPLAAIANILRNYLVL